MTWRRRVAGDELGAVEGVGADPGEGRAARELAGADVEASGQTPYFG